MHVFNTRGELKTFVTNQRKDSKIIGFVPTMGSLHAGHLTLISESNTACDVTLASIFVNPTQFNNKEDLDKYPRDLNGDLQKLKDAGCTGVFIPSVEDIYPNQVQTSFNFGTLETVMEGKFRSGHFNGVALIVSKLFHIFQPDKAFFGLKDLQQYTIIKQMVEDLDYPLEVLGVETVRETDGLAMSSRNLRLTESERRQAPFLYQQLQQAKRNLIDGQAVDKVRDDAISNIKNSNFELEYFEIVNAKTLLSVNNTDEADSIHICVAAFLGKVRLIDNILVF